jgi:hypothetical protein
METIAQTAEEIAQATQDAYSRLRDTDHGSPALVRS